MGAMTTRKTSPTKRPEIAEMQTRQGELSSPHLSPVHGGGGGMHGLGDLPLICLLVSPPPPPIVRVVCGSVCCVLFALCVLFSV